MDQKVHKHTRRHINLFDALAGIYGWGFHMQYKIYGRWAGQLDTLLPRVQGQTMLDVGCGTGAWAAVWADRGMRVTAIDPSPRMIQESTRRNSQRSIQFIQTDGSTPYGFGEASYDMVTSCLVLHGLKAQIRRAILLEMRRISRGLVVILDYNGRRNPVTDTIEWLEGGDYFDFQKHGLEEMKSVFTTVEKTDLSLGLCLYICKA